jgi:hypothetical protein
MVSAGLLVSCPGLEEILGANLAAGCAVAGLFSGKTGFRSTNIPHHVRYWLQSHHHRSEDYHHEHHRI